MNVDVWLPPVLAAVIGSLLSPSVGKGLLMLAGARARRIKHVPVDGAELYPNGVPMDPSWLTIRVSGLGRHCDQQVRGSRVPVWRTNPGRSQRRCVRQSPAYGIGGQEVARAGAFRVHRGHR